MHCMRPNNIFQKISFYKHCLKTQTFTIIVQRGKNTKKKITWGPQTEDHILESFNPRLTSDLVGI